MAKIPKKPRLRKIADDIWSAAVKEDWAHSCGVCGRIDVLNAHHMIPREFYATRFDMRNGIALCTHHHVWDSEVSPHQNAPGFMLWLESHHPQRDAWLTETLTSDGHKKFPESGKTTAFFCSKIRYLMQFVEEADCMRIVGQRFAAWLEEQEDVE